VSAAKNLSARTKNFQEKHLSPSRRRGSRSFFVKLAERWSHKGNAGHTGALTAWNAFHSVKGFLAFGIFLSSALKMANLAQLPMTSKAQGRKRKTVES
jgi:hypothetical protein